MQFDYAEGEFRKQATKLIENIMYTFLNLQRNSN